MYVHALSLLVVSRTLPRVRELKLIAAILELIRERVAPFPGCVN